MTGFRLNWLTATLALGAVGATLLILSSCSTVTRTALAPPGIEGAEFVGNKACADCHANVTRQFPGSAHARFHKDDPAWAGRTGCESCHGPGSLHVKSPGRGKFIVNPRQDPATCYNCHLETHAEFNLPQHHPVTEGRMHCVSCHDPHGRDALKPARAGLAMARLNETCLPCHREQARPFVYEHEALREGCTACHQPHGSVNPKMLVQRDNNLCLKCHSQIQAVAGQVAIGKKNHSDFVNRGSCWSAGCHAAVHGSNINPKLQY